MHTKTWKIGEATVKYDEDVSFCRLSPKGSREHHPVLGLTVISGVVNPNTAKQAAKNVFGLQVVLTKNRLELNTTQRVKSREDAIDLMDQFAEMYTEVHLERLSRINADAHRGPLNAKAFF